MGRPRDADEARAAGVLLQLLAAWGAMLAHSGAPTRRGRRGGRRLDCVAMPVVCPDVGGSS
eukprot:6488587-Lingulodinium_polyedra.AAC.1